MQEKLIVGVDVSKATLDICLKPSGCLLQIANEARGFKKLKKQLEAVQAGEVLVVMEHTGRYSLKLEKYLESNSIPFCKIAALEILRSSGMTREKNDKVDAGRIAEYAWLRRDILIADLPLSEDIRQLRSLVSLRTKLVKDRSGYMARLKEMLATGSCSTKGHESKIQKRLIDVLSQAIKEVEVEINALIRSNKALENTFNLLISLKGVGLIIAAYMIGCTENFQKFANARKFNCYAGLAPFKRQSGSSIKGRSKVSHLANKQAKALLNMAASCAIQHDRELKQYYLKRTSEGMKNMSCLNIIRSKIVARMFAVVKRQSPYQELLSAA